MSLSKKILPYRRKPSDRTPTAYDDALTGTLDGVCVLSIERSELIVYDEREGSAGLWVYPHSEHGNPYCILSTLITIDRVHGSLDPARSSSYDITFTPDGCQPVQVSGVTRRDWFDDRVFNPLAGLCKTPVQPKDKGWAWTGIERLAKRAVGRDAAIRQVLVPSLGWYEGVFVLANGHIAADGPQLGGSYRANVDDCLLYRLPSPLPSPSGTRIGADLLRKLAWYWHPSETLYALADIGAHTSIQQPHLEGASRFELEQYGETGWHKTAHDNAGKRAFQGAGFQYDSGTELTETDTKIGQPELRAQLRYCRYTDWDHNARTGTLLRDQQQHRCASLSLTGDKATGGVRSSREGGARHRSTPGGCLARLGEADPHAYSLVEMKKSQDARAVTYKIQGNKETRRAERERLSRELTARSAELDAHHLQFKQWLAVQGVDGCRDAWEGYDAQTTQLLDAGNVRESYPKAHERCEGQVRDLVNGLLCWAAYLRATDAKTGIWDGHQVIDGGAELADEVEAALPAFIADRYAASHEIMERHEARSGGATWHDARARAVLTILRRANADHKLCTTDQYDTVPDALPDGCTPGDLGWTLTPRREYDRQEEKYIDRQQYEPNRKATWRAFLTEHTGLWAVTSNTLDALLTEYRLEGYSTLDDLLKDLRRADVIVWQDSPADKDHPNGRRRYDAVVKYQGVSSRRVCFKVAGIWPVDNDETRKNAITGVTGVTGVTGDGNPEKFGTAAPEYGYPGGVTSGVTGVTENSEQEAIAGETESRNTSGMTEQEITPADSFNGTVTPVTPVTPVIASVKSGDGTVPAWVDPMAGAAPVVVADLVADYADLLQAIVPERREVVRIAEAARVYHQAGRPAITIRAPGQKTSHTRQGIPLFQELNNLFTSGDNSLFAYAWEMFGELAKEITR